MFRVLAQDVQHPFQVDRVIGRHRANWWPEKEDYDQPPMTSSARAAILDCSRSKSHPLSIISDLQFHGFDGYEQSSMRLLCVSVLLGSKLHASSERLAECLNSAAEEWALVGTESKY